jgi:hypothetical protein
MPSLIIQTDKDWEENFYAAFLAEWRFGDIVGRTLKCGTSFGGLGSPPYIRPRFLPYINTPLRINTYD